MQQKFVIVLAAMKAIKKILFKLLGEKAYLIIVSKVYIFCIKAGLLKTQYPELHYLKTIIKQGDVCIDFGANVGYYSHFLSDYCSVGGHVHAVEPVPLFAEVFKINTIHKRNVTLHPYAMGENEGDAWMKTPMVNGIFRHGLTQVVDENTAQEAEHSYKVPMKNPQKLFEKLLRLDYIKCDVEGYEIYLLPQISALVNKHKPTLQVEITGEENRNVIFNWMKELNYQVLKLNNGKLEFLSFNEALTYNGGDFYFKPVV